jgi:hypothetical protein
MNKQSIKIEHLDGTYKESTVLQEPTLQVEKGLKKTTTWTAEVLIKVTSLTLLFAVLLSFDYTKFALSNAIAEATIQVIIFALITTLLLSYFVLSSCWTGWKEWGAVLALLYGMVYVLTAAETFYLGSILPMGVVFSLIVNGAIVSAVYSGALVWAFSSKKPQSRVSSSRLQMPVSEWIWKILSLAIVYLLLFMVFGGMVYMPLAMLLDPVALASEQSIAASAAALVFPIELIRGALWALLAVPAIVALSFDWKKTGLVIGLLMAVPLTLSQFMSTTETIGLQLAHSVEILGANMVFGVLLVWILRIHSRLPSDGLLESTRG